jgi:hypothetical protein|nr:MAG TPA: hypothetical protein [Bacteriophage sp.]
MINLTFETFDEMVAFAGQILGTQTEKVVAAPTASVQQPTQSVTPQAPAAPTTSVTPETDTSTKPIPTQSVKYTMADLAEAAADLMDTNLEGLRDLLNSFGVEALPKLPEDKYPEFAAGLRALGGNI